MVASCKLKEGQKVLLVSYHAPYKDEKMAKIHHFQEFLEFVEEAKIELRCDQVRVSFHTFSWGFDLVSFF